jgi:hypothetical protein
MTKENLKELLTLDYCLDNIKGHRERFLSITSERDAVSYLIGGGNFNPSNETWEKIHALLKEEIAQREAELQVAFETA